MDDSEYALSFSARDLLIRLVRENRAIRGRLTVLSEPLRLHRGGYPEPAVQIADARELLDHGLIDFRRNGFSVERNCTSPRRRAYKRPAWRRLRTPKGQPRSTKTNVSFLIVLAP